MYTFELTIGFATVLIWIVLVFFRGNFWKTSQSAGVSLKPDYDASRTRRIAVIIPARNEADVIGRAITSLLQQNTNAEIHIFLVDDASSDGTADVARQAAADLGQIDCLTVLTAEPLPPGWSGKLWAIRAGIEQARSLHPTQADTGLERAEYFLLTDADIVHAPDSIDTLLSIAEAGPYDLTSFMVKLHCESLAERLLIPAFVYFFFKLYPPRWIASPRHRVAGAAGGCMLVRPEELERAGGIDAIRSEIIDDCALAHWIKRSGGRVWLGLERPFTPTPGLNGAPIRTTSIRPYDSFAAIEHMIARTAFNQLRHSSLLLLGCIIGLTLTYIAPVLLQFSGHLVPAVLGITAFIMMVGSYMPMVRYYELNPIWAFSLPAAALFYMGATVHSALNYWTGRGGQWKGRAQDQSEATAEP